MIIVIRERDWSKYLAGFVPNCNDMLLVSTCYYTNTKSRLPN